jgi:anti-anti-sigma factor
MSLDDLSSPLRIAGESGRSVSDTRERVSHDVSIVEVEGPRVPVNGELRHRVLFLLRHGERHIVLNLAHVSRIDAAGVGELVRSYNVAMAAKGGLRITRVTRYVRSILKRVGLFEILSTGRKPR